MITALVIDDEKPNHQLIEQFILTLEVNVKIIGFSQSIENAIILIRNKKPDIIFLDIKLKGRTGFDILELFPQRNFEVVLVTAYPEFKEQAKELGLFNYLLKPLGLDDFKKAIQRAEEQIELRKMRRVVKLKQVLIPTKFGFKFIHVDHIMWLETVKGESKTILHLIKKGSLTARQTLGFFEAQLKQFSFIRIHNSFIVNVNFVDAYHSDADGGKVVLSDNTPVKVSRNKKKIFLAYLREIDPDIDMLDD